MSLPATIQNGIQLPTPSVNSPEWLQRQKANLSRSCTDSDFFKQFVRLAANYGDSKISTPAQRTLLVREWAEAFSHNSPDHLHEAVSQAMLLCKFWPTIAEISQEIKKARRDSVEAVEALSLKGRQRPAETVFAREGRSVSQETAFRVAQVLRMKQESGFGKSVVEEHEVRTAPLEASQATFVTDELMHSRAAKIARGEAR